MLHGLEGPWAILFLNGQVKHEASVAQKYNYGHITAALHMCTFLPQIVQSTLTVLFKKLPPFFFFFTRAENAQEITFSSKPLE